MCLLRTKTRMAEEARAFEDFMSSHSPEKVTIIVAVPTWPPCIYIFEEITWKNSKLGFSLNHVRLPHSCSASEERMNEILSNAKVAAYFQTLDLDVHEAAVGLSCKDLISTNLLTAHHPTCLATCLTQFPFQGQICQYAGQILFPKCIDWLRKQSELGLWWVSLSICVRELSPSLYL